MGEFATLGKDVLIRLQLTISTDALIRHCSSIEGAANDKALLKH